jgi:hypothetical protein
MSLQLGKAPEQLNPSALFNKRVKVSLKCLLSSKMATLIKWVIYVKLMENRCIKNSEIGLGRYRKLDKNSKKKILHLGYSQQFLMKKYSN